jgi:hypothetical protein
MSAVCINGTPQRQMPCTILAGAADSQSPAAHVLMQIRHNLVVPEKPFFRRGSCVQKAAPHVGASETTGFFAMKPILRYGITTP